MKQFLTLLLLIVLLHPASLRAAYDPEVNSVLSLNGSSYLSVVYHDDLNVLLTNGGTVAFSAWVRPTASGSEMTIIGNDRAMGYWFGLNAQGSLRYYPNPQNFYDGKATIPLNTWSHVAVSFDVFKNNLRFYVNGALDRQINTNQTYLAFAYSDFRIGADRQANSPAMYWSGQLDEVRVWSLDIDFSTAEGALYRIPLAMFGGRYGRWMTAAWRFNGNPFGVDRALDAVAVGSVSYPATPDPGHYNRIGLQLVNGPDLGDHLTIPHAASLSFAENFTLECWVRPASTGGHSQYQTLITKGSYSRTTYQYWLGLNKGNGKIRFQPTGSFSSALESAAPIPVGSWTHVAARLQRNGVNYQAAIFINGVPSATMTFAQPGTGNTHELLIGCADIRSTGSTAYGYAGTIDEVRIWNIARGNDAIADHHRMEFQGPEKGLVACYRLDGDDVDHSGIGNHGSGSFRTGSMAFFTNTLSLPAAPTLTLTRPLGGEGWEIGATEEIRWAATGLINVRLELSRDGGQTFGEVLANSVPASPAVFSWSVSGPPTSNAVVRVRPPSTLMLTDESGAFEIADPVPILDVQPRQLVFTASPNGPLPPAQVVRIRNTGGAMLNWTAQPSSVLWYDLSASSGTANEDSVIVSINTTNFPEGSYSDNMVIGGNALNAPIAVNIVLRITPLASYTVSGTVLDAAGAPVEGVRVRANGNDDLSGLTDTSGRYTIAGLPGGNTTIAPVSPFFSFTPPSRDYQNVAADLVDVDFTAQRGTGAVVIRYAAGWNLISIPFHAVPDGVADVFPDAEGKAYEYVPSQGYIETDRLAYGKGYWLKFPAPDSVVVTGLLEHILDYTAQDQFGGWNLMGAPSGPAPVGGIVQSPAGSIVAVFGYDPAVGYFLPPGGQLAPGRGYFVKVNTTAVLHVVAATFAPLYESMEQLRHWMVAR